jgi:hypothetical protein
MTEEAQSRKRGRRRRAALALAAALVIIAVVPPLINVSRYKGRITQLMAASLGRPVRLSSVSVRLLPRPGFVLYDLSVAEDPAYGAEPVLHANTVTASLRFLSLWRGRLEIGRVSVDEASLNLVRSAPGRWNLDPLFRITAARAGAAAQETPRRAMRLPYLEATNSRINFKNGVEKLPFSVVNAELSFWQQDNGEWSIRLRGQPARTDVSLDLGDTGIVRMEGTIRPAAGLQQMPSRIDVEWREAQLGQLTRLITGSDPGWRGDLTGQFHLEGTADAARITTRLRATRVHRAEFAPSAPLDFDANCSLVYHYMERSVENLVCDSPLGSGRIRVTGSIAGSGAQPRFQVALDRIPAAAALDALRTVRSGIDESLEAGGTVSGSIGYDAGAAQAAASSRTQRAHAARAAAAPQGPLTGSLTIDGVELSGGGLSQPLHVPRFTLQPGEALPGHLQTLSGSTGIPAGGATPLQISLQFTLAGYQVSLRGPAALARAREMAHAAGIAGGTILDFLAGDAAVLDLSAEGGWLPASAAGLVAPDTEVAGKASAPAAGSLSGTITLHNANWRADYLANHVLISQATIHMGENGTRWDPVVFSLGPVKGTASLKLPASCRQEAACAPALQLRFGALDAATVQDALLGARQPGTLLSTLIERLHASATVAWPRLDAAFKADSLRLGAITLEEPAAMVRILPAAAEIDSLDAVLFGGRVHFSGSIEKPATSTDKPEYTLEGSLEQLNGASAAGVLGLARTAGKLDVEGKIELSGYSDRDLAASAAGTAHFVWRSGSVGNQSKGPGAGAQKSNPIPAALGRFDRWSGDGEIGGGKIAFKASEVDSGSHKRAVDATVVFGAPAKVTFPLPMGNEAKR